MATATKKSPAVKRPGRSAADGRAPELMEFLIVEDNGGRYHWKIAGADGATLVRSSGFISHDDAEQAAQRVRSAAASARFGASDRSSSGRAVTR
jgi:uncharacterized protein YegP (UPF0339 family)